MSIRSNRTDFENNLRELKGKKATDSCTSCDKNYIVLIKCKECGFIYKKEDLS